MTDDAWEFCLTEEAPKPVYSDSDWKQAAGYLNGVGRWDNYTDEILYEVEKGIREWAEDSYTNNPDDWEHGFRMANQVIFQILYGRPYTKDDSKVALRIGRILNHYATKWYERVLLNGKNTNNVYLLSKKRFENEKPFSLKLRLEWLMEQGEVPTKENMAVFKAKGRNKNHRGRKGPNYYGEL